MCVASLWSIRIGDGHWILLTIQNHCYCCCMLLTVSGGLHTSRRTLVERPWHQLQVWFPTRHGAARRFVCQARPPRRRPRRPPTPCRRAATFHPISSELLNEPRSLPSLRAKGLESVWGESLQSIRPVRWAALLTSICPFRACRDALCIMGLSAVSLMLCFNANQLLHFQASLQAIVSCLCP